MYELPPMFAKFQASHLQHQYCVLQRDVRVEAEDLFVIELRLFGMLINLRQDLELHHNRLE